MKKIKNSKLTLDKVTISDLSNRELENMNGGVGGALWTDVNYTCRWGTYQEYCTLSNCTHLAM
ncbi:MAG: hypothetical protein GY765_18550, partial [bacterium]|nr:hypothetical protein [bacterium]